MNNETKTMALPVRISWMIGSRATVIAGTPESGGDAGWSLVEVAVFDLAGFMARHPAARMPCWRRFEAGGDLAHLAAG